MTIGWWGFDAAGNTKFHCGPLSICPRPSERRYLRSPRKIHGYGRNFACTFGCEEQRRAVVQLRRGRDETGSANQISFARRGSTDVSVVVPTEGKEQYTVLVCGSAAGKFLPPFVIVCIGGVFLLANVRYCILPKY